MRTVSITKVKSMVLSLCVAVFVLGFVAIILHALDRVFPEPFDSFFKNTGIFLIEPTLQIYSNQEAKVQWRIPNKCSHNKYSVHYKPANGWGQRYGTEGKPECRKTHLGYDCIIDLKQDDVLGIGKNTYKLQVLHSQCNDGQDRISTVLEFEI